MYEKTSRSLQLGMGLLDSVTDFFSDRQGDFVKLEESGEIFGPGPLILMYGVPNGVLDEEIQDMIADGAPVASRKGTKLIRLKANDPLLEQPLERALEMAVDMELAAETLVPSAVKIPVLIFSGFLNTEMIATYNIMGPEIYQETGGISTTACAKAVPNAMSKPLRQVIEEISGDHADATGSSYLD